MLCLAAKGVLIFNLLATAVCIALGVPILIASLGVVEVKQRYDNAGSLAGLSYPNASLALIATNGVGLSQTVTVTIPKNMTPPVSILSCQGDELQKLVAVTTLQSMGLPVLHVKSSRLGLAPVSPCSRTWWHSSVAAFKPHV